MSLDLDDFGLSENDDAPAEPTYTLVTPVAATALLDTQVFDEGGVTRTRRCEHLASIINVTGGNKPIPNGAALAISTEYINVENEPVEFDGEKNFKFGALSSELSMTAGGRIMKSAMLFDESCKFEDTFDVIEDSVVAWPGRASNDDVNAEELTVDEKSPDVAVDQTFLDNAAVLFAKDNRPTYARVHMVAITLGKLRARYQGYIDTAQCSIDQPTERMRARFPDDDDRKARLNGLIATYTKRVDDINTVISRVGNKGEKPGNSAKDRNAAKTWEAQPDSGTLETIAVVIPEYTPLTAKMFTENKDSLAAFIGIAKKNKQRMAAVVEADNALDRTTNFAVSMPKQGTVMHLKLAIKFLMPITHEYFYEILKARLSKKGAESPKKPAAAAAAAKEPTPPPPIATKSAPKPAPKPADMAKATVSTTANSVIDELKKKQEIAESEKLQSDVVPEGTAKSAKKTAAASKKKEGDEATAVDEDGGESPKPARKNKRKAAATKATPAAKTAKKKTSESATSGSASEDGDVFEFARENVKTWTIDDNHEAIAKVVVDNFDGHIKRVASGKMSAKQYYGHFAGVTSENIGDMPKPAKLAITNFYQVCTIMGIEKSIRDLIKGAQKYSDDLKAATAAAAEEENKAADDDEEEEEEYCAF